MEKTSSFQFVSRMILSISTHSVRASEQFFFFERESTVGNENGRAVRL